MLNRRTFMTGLGAGMALASGLSPTWARENRQTLAMPPLLDATRSGRFELNAMAGSVNFLGGAESRTWGFSQPYLGPTLRLSSSGETHARVENRLKEAISVHWHGLIIPGNVDGGPHQPVRPKETWEPVLPIAQAPTTLWYHSHIHGKTAEQVHHGLAGVLQLTDGKDDERGLPSDYGVDDLTLILQDRRFDSRGRTSYDPGMEDLMMGFAGDTMLINGQFAPIAAVPKGIVRLRILNASNGRIYTLALSDGRDMHLAGTDSGLLDRPLPLPMITLAPAERIEILVDFSDGADLSLVSGPNLNAGGMMGGMMGRRAAPETAFEILPFVVDSSLPARITSIPGDIGGSLAQVQDPVATTRRFTLEMPMGPRMMFGGTRRYSISGAPFDMKTINHGVRNNTVERWVVSAHMLMHPFHIHGVTFQVLSENGGPPRAQNRGWKDTVLVNGQVELLVPFTQTAGKDYPFMYHCHILEHEDGGMMGQFTVT